MSRTLADMTPAEQQACVGMWCDNLVSTLESPNPVILSGVQGGSCWVIHTGLYGERWRFSLNRVAPRPELPRAWTPDGKPVPGEWEYRPAYIGVEPDGKKSIGIATGFRSVDREAVERKCDEISKHDDEVHFFPARRFSSEWEEA